MDCRRPVKRCWRNFRKSKPTDLASFYKIRQRFSHFLYWRVGIAAMYIKQINMIKAQTCQTAVNSLPEISGCVVKIALAAIAVGGDTSLCCNREHIMFLAALMRQK